jgi:hypothetical protein
MKKSARNMIEELETTSSVGSTVATIITITAVQHNAPHGVDSVKYYV